ncbi:MAG: DedA family protein [Solirubrobacteraceae bacterium]|nr:DedA family protein [Solirubrobacteraceae bacterium]
MLTPYLTLASLTEPLVNLAEKIVNEVGLVGIFFAMTVESACIPFPSEPTMLAAGFASARGDMAFMAIVLVATVANVIGSWIGYAIGYYGRVEALEKHKWIHLDAKQLARNEKWFREHGGITVFVTRLLPIVRTFSSVPAGAARMPLGKFTAYTAAGCFLWMLGLTYLGRKVGENWKDLQDKLHYVDYLVAVVIVGVAIWLFLRWWKGRGQGQIDAAVAEDVGLTADASVEPNANEPAL